jgi:hypothetical protein
MKRNDAIALSKILMDFGVDLSWLSINEITSQNWIVQVNSSFNLRFMEGLIEGKNLAIKENKGYLIIYDPITV